MHLRPTLLVSFCHNTTPAVLMKHLLASLGAQGGGEVHCHEDWA